MKKTLTILAVLATLPLLLSSCACNETTNNYTITGDGNRFDTNQSSSTSKPVDVQTYIAGSGYGEVQR